MYTPGNQHVRKSLDKVFYNKLPTSKWFKLRSGRSGINQ